MYWVEVLLSWCIGVKKNIRCRAVIDVVTDKICCKEFNFFWKCVKMKTCGLVAVKEVVVECYRNCCCGIRLMSHEPPWFFIISFERSLKWMFRLYEGYSLCVVLFRGGHLTLIALVKCIIRYFHHFPIFVRIGRMHFQMSKVSKMWS